MSADSSKKPPPVPLTPRASWGPGGAITLTIVLFFATQFVAGLLLGGVLGLFGKAWTDTVVNMVIFGLLADALLVWALWYYIRIKRGTLAQLGFGRWLVWRDVGIALLGFGVYWVALMLAVPLVDALTAIDVNQKQELGFDGISGALPIMLGFVGLAVLPPLVEEILFRGFLFGGLRTKLPFVGAAVVTSLLFAAPHLAASSAGPLWIGAVDTFVLSMVLCYAREKTGTLWAPILIHGIKNSFAFLYLVGVLVVG